MITNDAPPLDASWDRYTTRAAGAHLLRIAAGFWELAAMKGNETWRPIAEETALALVQAATTGVESEDALVLLARQRLNLDDREVAQLLSTIRGMADTLRGQLTLFGQPTVPDEAEVLTRATSGAVRATAVFVDAAVKAVRHTLDRSQTDADFGYLVGPGTQSFRLLCEAEAALSGRPVAEISAARATSHATLPRQYLTRAEFEALSSKDRS